MRYIFDSNTSQIMDTRNNIAVLKASQHCGVGVAARLSEHQEIIDDQDEQIKQLTTLLNERDKFFENIIGEAMERVKLDRTRR